MTTYYLKADASDNISWSTSPNTSGGERAFKEVTATPQWAENLFGGPDSGQLRIDSTTDVPSYVP